MVCFCQIFSLSLMNEWLARQGRIHISVEMSFHRCVLYHFFFTDVPLLGKPCGLVFRCYVTCACIIYFQTYGSCSFVDLFSCSVTLPKCTSVFGICTHFKPPSECTRERPLIWPGHNSVLLLSRVQCVSFQSFPQKQVEDFLRKLMPEGFRPLITV